MKGGVKNAVGGRALWLLADVALVVALALILAYWTAELTSPPAVAAFTLPTDSKTVDAGAIAGRHLFGAAADQPIGEVGSMSRLKLLGVIAPGRAVLAADGARARSFTAGDSVATGITLKEVHADRVVVTNNGTLETLKLERRVARVERSPSTRLNGSR